MDELNDACLLTQATERMTHFNPDTLISQEYIDEKFGFTEDVLKNIDVDIE